MKMGLLVFSLLSVSKACTWSFNCRSGQPVYVSFQNTPSPSFFFGINQQGVLAEMGWFLYPSFSFVNWQAQWWERKRTKDRAVVTGRGWESGSLPVTLCPGLISTLSCRPNFKVLPRSSLFLTKSWWKGRKELWPQSTCRQVTLLGGHFYTKSKIHAIVMFPWNTCEVVTWP